MTNRKDELRMKMYAVCEVEGVHKIVEYLSGADLPENLKHVYVSSEKASEKAKQLNLHRV